MGSMTTFGAFTAARLGMYASMKGLDVTGHNIANINTKGYTRQVLDQVSLRLSGSDKYASVYDARVGTGVLVTSISQLRDPYLDLRYRDEQSSVGAMDAKLSALEDLKRVFDEVGKNDGAGLITKQFQDLLTQLENLSDKVGQGEFDTLVRTSASTLASMLNKAATDLEKAEAGQEKYLQQDIDTVNGILKNIRDLNDSIRKSDIHGDNALELRDERNRLLDQLSQYMKIDVTYGTEQIGAGSSIQKLIVTLEDGTKLIDGQYGTQVSLPTELLKTNTNYDPNETDPTSPNFGQYLKEDPANPGSFLGTNVAADAAKLDNDYYYIGLSAMTNKAGDVMNGSTSTVLGHTAIGGAIDATRQMLTAGGEFSLAGNPNMSTVRGIPYYKASLDALASKFASVMNDANRPYEVDGDGNYLDSTGQKITDPDNAAGFLNNKLPLTQTQKDALTLNGKRVGSTDPLFSNSNAGNDPTGITAKNIAISKSWSTGATKLTASAVNAGYNTSTKNDNITHFIQLITGSQDYKPSDGVTGPLAGNDSVYFSGSFEQMFVGTAGTLANDIKTTTTMLNNYAAAATELDTSRDSVSGVDLNDEAANMMQYQKSYAAACRMMTTIDEALDKLINGTGVVGR